MKKITTVIAQAIVIILSCASVSCRTTNLNSAAPILIPAGLSTQEVKLAILSAIYPDKAPREWTPMEKMTDNALKAAFGFGYSKVNRSGQWFIEEVKEKSVVAGFERGKYYFRVEFIAEGNQLIQRIDGSRNLEQSNNSIHKSVFDWLGEMESKIRQSMGVISAMKAGASRQ